MKKFFYLFIIVAIGLNLYLNENRPSENPDEYYVWANLLYWLNLIPIALYLRGGYRNEIYPFMGTVSLFILFSYALPPFFIRISNYQLGLLNIEALQWGFWAYLIFYITYYSLKNKSYFKIKPFDPLKDFNINNPKIRYAAILFLGLYISTLFFTVASLYHLGKLGIFIYLGTYLFLINKKIKISKLEKLLFGLVLSYETITRLLDGLLSLIALLFLFVAIIHFYSSKKPQTVMALMIVFFIASYIVIAPVKSKFREIVWYSGQEFSLGERSALIYDLYKDYQYDKDIRTQESIDKSNFFWRYSYQASALSLVIENTPSRIPYWEGESYTLLSKFIPRFFWPDKPQETMGYKFGTRYGILSQYNFSTSMNTPMVTEMYMNFGYYGIVIGMILLAIVNIYLNNYFNQNTISDIGKVYAVSIIFPFIAHESNFSLTYGNIPLIVITVYLLMRFYLRVEK